MADIKSLVPTEVIEKKIYFIRGQKVILDTDLAELFCVETKRLNEQVKRNRSRFPKDFMIQLTQEETKTWQCSLSTGPLCESEVILISFVLIPVVRTSEVIMDKEILKYDEDVLQSMIIIVRGRRVILSSVLAGLYGVEPKVLNQAVKRNERRFPTDFVFKLTSEEAQHSLRSRSQTVTLNR